MNKVGLMQKMSVRSLHDELELYQKQLIYYILGDKFFFLSHLKSSIYCSILQNMNKFSPKLGHHYFLICSVLHNYAKNFLWKNYSRFSAKF